MDFWEIWERKYQNVLLKPLLQHNQAETASNQWRSLDKVDRWNSWVAHTQTNTRLHVRLTGLCMRFMTKAVSCHIFAKIWLIGTRWTWMKMIVLQVWFEKFLSTILICFMWPENFPALEAIVIAFITTWLQPSFSFMNTNQLCTGHRACRDKFRWVAAGGQVEKKSIKFLTALSAHTFSCLMILMQFQIHWLTFCPFES